jgi:hypothetical protein
MPHDEPLELPSVLSTLKWIFFGSREEQMVKILPNIILKYFNKLDYASG